MEEKIARVCWNTQNWRKPSGSSGKSKDTNSFEVNPGFGHEEWIFDFEKLINGYKYSFLDPLRTEKNSYKDKIFSIWLYALTNGQRYCIAKINKAICIDIEEANKTVGIYKENNWLDEMKGDLDNIGLSTNNLDNDNPLLNFNVKFDPKDIVFFKPLIELDKVLIPSHRYNLQSAKEDFLGFMSERAAFGENNEVAEDIANIINDDLSTSEKSTLVNARIGQGQFRKNVIDLWGNGEQCAVTLVDIKEILIASHIKAWRDCVNTPERLDGANGILLCSHIDKLFDRYLITFIKKNRNFELKINPKIDRSQLKSLQINEGDSLNLDGFDMDSKVRFENYIEYHNKIFFENLNK
ncbi:MAG: HNH endonuclease signature motif containing protein [Methylobacter sp.]|nr:HNH endonuclease signature motif containing protein [Methylobacter sp.]